ncbi:hypothetical protein GCM10027085_03800 [Spirosoma aerophilum]
MYKKYDVAVEDSFKPPSIGIIDYLPSGSIFRAKVTTKHFVTFFFSIV